MQEKEDLILMLVEYYAMVDKSRGMVKMEDLLDILRNQLNDTNTKTMLNKVRSVVFIVAKSMEDIDKDDRINTNIQDIVEHYRDIFFLAGPPSTRNGHIGKYIK